MEIPDTIIIYSEEVFINKVPKDTTKTYLLLAHTANVTRTQMNCFSFGISLQHWVARFPSTSNLQCISINKWGSFIVSLCLNPPLIL